MKSIYDSWLADNAAAEAHAAERAAALPHDPAREEAEWDDADAEYLRCGGDDEEYDAYLDRLSAELDADLDRQADYDSWLDQQEQLSVQNTTEPWDDPNCEDARMPF